jgi:replicative DNA helicase
MTTNDDINIEEESRCDALRTEYHQCKQLVLEYSEMVKRCISRAKEINRQANIESDIELIKLDPKEYRNLNQQATTEFLDDIQSNRTFKPISTGLPELDRMLDSGLHEGLYVLGAVPGVGKTSLCLQIADHIAEQGQDVLYISFEMSRFELYCRSISRLGLFNNMRLTARQIMKGSFIDSKTDLDLYTKTHQDYYSNVAKNMFIVEVGFNSSNAEDIREKVENHIELTGKTPVVFVDYLQIITPFDVRATDKQNMDKTITALKQTSRDFKTPVIAISSLKRAAYKDRITYDSFKESGAVEYSSDVLIGLQPAGKGLDEGKGKDKEAMQQQEDFMKQPEKEMEIVIVKNRHGSNGDVKVEWKCLYNHWE